MRFAVVAIVAAAAASLAGSPGAFAACAPSTPPDAAVAQYVEQVPTSCGSQSPNGVSHKTTLTKRVQKKVQSAGKRASALKTIATDSTYGAPQQSLPSRPTTTPTTTPAPTAPAAKPKPHKRHVRPAHRAKKHRAKTLPAAPKKPRVPTIHVTVAPATSGVQSGRVVGLLVVLLGATVAVFAAARRRRGPRTAVS